MKTVLGDKPREPEIKKKTRKRKRKKRHHEFDIPCFRNLITFTLGSFKIRGKQSSGSYGKIIMTKLLEDHQVDGETILSKETPLALKIYMGDEHESMIANFREIDILLRLQGHPFIVPLTGVVIGTPFKNTDAGEGLDMVSFVMPRADYDLDAVWEGKVPKEFSVKKLLAAQMGLALEYTHHLGFVHRDLKGNNVMVYEGEDGPKAVLIDYGIAKYHSLDIPEEKRFYNVEYRPYELTGGRDGKMCYGSETDVWAFGCLLFLLFTGKYFVNLPRRTSVKMVQQSIRSRLGMDSSSGKQILDMGKELREVVLDKEEALRLHDLLSKMLLLDPANRLSMTQILDHPFFDQERELINKTRVLLPPSDQILDHEKLLLKPLTPMLVDALGQFLGAIEDTDKEWHYKRLPFYFYSASHHYFQNKDVSLGEIEKTIRILSSGNEVITLTTKLSRMFTYIAYIGFKLYSTRVVAYETFLEDLMLALPRHVSDVELHMEHTAFELSFLGICEGLSHFPTIIDLALHEKRPVDDHEAFLLFLQEKLKENSLTEMVTDLRSLLYEFTEEEADIGPEEQGEELSFIDPDEDLFFTTSDDEEVFNGTTLQEAEDEIPVPTPEVNSSSLAEE